MHRNWHLGRSGTRASSLPYCLSGYFFQHVFYINFLYFCISATNHGAYAGDIESNLNFTKEQVCLVSDTRAIPLLVEIAASVPQHRRGLMAREKLAENSGMLFTYHRIQPPQRGFWMYNTLIPLDIAFIDHKGKIRAIQSLSPCPKPDAKQCPVYRAGVKFKSVLELNQGFFQHQGIQVGDHLVRGNLSPCNEPH